MQNLRETGLNPNLNRQVNIAVLESSGPSLLIIDGLKKSNQFNIKIFLDPSKMEEWIMLNLPALVILPLALREDLIRVAPIVRTAIKMQSYSKLKFVAVTDLEQRLATIPAAQATIRMLQGIMDFFPLKGTVDEFSHCVIQCLNELNEEKSEPKASKEYFFFRGKQTPETVEDVLAAYAQGIGIFRRMVQATDCVLIALDPNTQRYNVVSSTNPEHQEGEWDFKTSSLISRRDVLTNKGFYYLQPVRNYVSNDGNFSAYGFLYVYRERAKLPLNTDQESLLKTLAKEIEGLSQSYNG